jgi:hypothetical protein
VQKGRKRMKARIDLVLRVKYFFISPKKNENDTTTLIECILLEKFLPLIHLIDG